jgi:hypothetical protein
MDFSKHTARIINRMGELHQYSHAGGGAVPVLGVFSAPPKDDLTMEVFVPTVTCNFADVPLIKRGDTFLINSETYAVTNKDIDRVSGLVKADLEKQ